MQLARSEGRDFSLRLGLNSLNPSRLFSFERRFCVLAILVGSLFLGLHLGHYLG